MFESMKLLLVCCTSGWLSPENTDNKEAADTAAKCNLNEDIVM